MQNEGSDIKKWGYIGVIFSVFVILLSIIGFFVNYHYNLITITLLGFAALFASIILIGGKIAERYLLILQLGNGYIAFILWLMVYTGHMYKIHLKKTVENS